MSLHETINMMGLQFELKDYALTCQELNTVWFDHASVNRYVYNFPILNRIQLTGVIKNSIVMGEQCADVEFISIFIDSDDGLLLIFR